MSRSHAPPLPLWAHSRFVILVTAVPARLEPVATTPSSKIPLTHATIATTCATLRSRAARAGRRKARESMRAGLAWPGLTRGVDQLLAVGGRDRLCAAVYSELGEYVLDVRRDGLRGDREPLSDLTLAEAV